MSNKQKSNLYGPGVGRNLSSQDKQYKSVVFQPEKPPVSEEFNFLTELMDETRKEIVSSNVPSGFISNPYHPKSDYNFARLNSNQFWFGRQPSGGQSGIMHALVNGWVVPVAGTRSEDMRNVIQLDPPPSTDSRTDFVFLEVWKAQISPDGEVNKPFEDQIYRFGNVEYGGQNLTSQINDPRYKKETTERIQLQYRIRVESGISVDNNPYGFKGVTARGPESSPISGQHFENMAEELGDPGLWRAGDSHKTSEDGRIIKEQSPFETTDGYVYAIPLCLVFRRSQDGYWNTANQNKAVNRNPSANTRDDATNFLEINLTSDVGRDDLTLEVDQSQAATPFAEDGGLLQIGKEIIEYSLWSGTTIEVEERGVRDTHKTSHEEGSEVRHASGHPLDYFSDQVVEEDVFDLRHVTNMTGFSYDSLLKTNFMSLLRGDLKTQWKRARGGSYKGTRHFQVDHFGTEQAGASLYEGDAPDNFRKVFSDAASLQPENLLVINENELSLNLTDYTFNPSGDLYRENSSWQKGDNVKIDLDQFRQTFKTVEDNKVRFVHPLEYGDSKHEPLTIRFGDAAMGTLSEGPENQFIALGKVPEDVGDSTFLEGSSSEINFDDDAIDIAGNPILDFSTDDIANTLADQDAYLVIETSDESQVAYKGAYKILGSDGSTGLQVALPDEDLNNPDEIPNSPAFASDTLTCDWYILLRECTEQDDNLVVVLTNPEAGGGTEFIDNSSFYLTYDLLYHPNQGMIRVPEIPLVTRLIQEGADPYVKVNQLANKVGSTTRDVKDFPNRPMDSFPLDRTETRLRNNQDVTTSVEDIWAESYVDKGSKTLIFQPQQRASVHVDESSNPLGSTSEYGVSLGLGNDLDFNLGTGAFCQFVPKEVMPPTGRLDVPFVPTTFENSPYGINAIIQSVDGSGNSQNGALVQNRVLALLETGIDQNELASIGGLDGGDALPCQIYDEGGVRGIELPQHFGVCRIFGAYHKEDFEDNRSAFIGPNDQRADSATNLLKEYHQGRSLLITDDNSFIIPEEVLDLNLLEDDLSSATLVFEIAIFMFKDWKEDQIQIHSHGADPDVDESLNLLINGPANSNGTLKQISTRIPYQGNINGSMPDSSTATYFDYEAKQEVDRTNHIELLRESLDQREALVENPAKLEILTSMPFVTSLGTGRISGKVKDGTYTDVGYISQEGFPDSLDSTRGVKPRALESATQRTRADVLTGMTERLPAGLLASDHIFLGEGFLGGQKSFWTPSLSDLESAHVENEGGQLLNKSLGEGKVLFSDGTSRGGPDETTYDPDQNKYRTYRGGTLTEASGNARGGTFITSGPRLYKEFPQLRSFEAEHNHLISSYAKDEISMEVFDKEILKLQEKYQKRLQVNGGAIFGVAFLVRTAKEVVGDQENVMNWGSELQMLVVTGASIGVQEQLDQLEGDYNSREILDLLVQLHPTGFGEGFCAADRYHIKGRPLQKESKVGSDIDFDIYRGSDDIDEEDPKC